MLRFSTYKLVLGDYLHQTVGLFFVKENGFKGHKENAFRNVILVFILVLHFLP